MAYLDYPGLAYFKSLLDQTYLRIDYDGDTTIAGNVTFTNPITGDIDGRAKKDWLGQQFDTTYLKDIQSDESGALKLILGNGQVSHLVTDTTVTQERSSANETYPVLLCYDENATANQIAKKVKYGHDVQINPAYGYIYAQGYTEKHPAYNRTAAQSSRAEWMLDFRDSVLNPVGQIYSYIDPSGQGGEHRMEFRLYGNPHTTSLNLPNYNFETDTVSLGVSSTKGDKLTFFGYAPSTPIYLENGTTMRKSTVRGDQYGRDIITRDWLNLNGSITGLVHTYMDETIDGYKTFLKTVTIDSGNDNAKAGLNVQGDVNIDSGDASKPSNFYVQGNSHIHGNEDIDGNLNVDGTSDQHGNVHMYHNLDVDGNANTDGNQTIGGTLTVTGKITGNGGAEISGGNGLKVNGTTTTTNLSVTDDATIGDDLTVNGDELVKGNETVNGNSNIGGNANVGGTINKVSGNTTQEYVTYVTSQPATREVISQNLLALGKGLAKDSSGKIYVDFSQIDANTKAAILAGLDMQIPLSGNLAVHVNPSDSSSTDSFNLDFNTRVATPFKKIQKAIDWTSSKLALGTYGVYIHVHAGTYEENIVLPEVNASSGAITLMSASGNKDVIISPPLNSEGHYGNCIIANKGACRWNIMHITCNCKLPANVNVVGLAFMGIGAFCSGAIINVYGCDVIATPVNNTVTGEGYTCRMLNAEMGGELYIYPDDKGSSLEFRLPTNATPDVGIDVLNISRGGRMYFVTSTRSENGNVSCKGTCSAFCRVWQGGSTNLIGGAGAQIAFTVPAGQSVTGDRFHVTQGSSILAPSSGFPGQVRQDGGVETSTYCWVKPDSLTS